MDTIRAVTTHPTQLTLTRPDDWHVHLRDGEMLKQVVTDTARTFARAIIMPNLTSPIITTEQALAYRQRILKTVPKGLHFEPLMTLYLTDKTSPSEIITAANSKMIHGLKWYPAGATTHSESGVTDIRHCYTALAEMEKHDLPLLIDRKSVV